MALKKSCDDLIGKTYGTLLVIKEVEPRLTKYNQKITQVECECIICKKILVRDATSIRSRKINGHRGCTPTRYKYKEMTQDLIGETIGNWKVIEEFRDENNENKRMCKCECQCVYKTIANIGKYDLLAGRSTRCIRCGRNAKNWNRYDLTHEYGIGYTNKNEPFYFDKEDYDLIKDHKWIIDKMGYVVSTEQINNVRTTIKMHRLVMGLTNSKDVVDHIGHNTTDNRKSMLRICTQADNTKNRRQRKNKEIPTGITFDKTSNRWVVRVFENGLLKYSKHCKSLEEAILIRKAAEEKYFGEYSYNTSLKIAERNKIIQ